VVVACLAVWKFWTKQKKEKEPLNPWELIATARHWE
jgi:hypothetical protein